VNRSERQRWIQAVNPPESDENERIYEAWGKHSGDCLSIQFVSIFVGLFSQCTGIWQCRQTHFIANS